MLREYNVPGPLWTRARVAVLSSGPTVTVLAKAYLYVSMALFVLGMLWFVLVLQENRAWVEVVTLVPRFDFVDPLVRTRFRMNVAVLWAGWGGFVALLGLMVIVAPFRVRSMARLTRRMRDLEREVLDLRTLPLRQQEEDEILAAEAHLDIRAKKVMTEKMRRERLREGVEDGDEPHAPLGRPLELDEFRPPSARGEGV